MIQSGRILGELLAAISQTIILTGAEALKRGVKEGVTLAKNAAPELFEKATKTYVNKGINELNKKFTSSKGSEITLTNDGIKDIIKVSRCLENRGILLKGTTKELAVKKEYLSIF